MQIRHPQLQFFIDDIKITTTDTMAFSPVVLVSLMERALRSVIAKVRVPFPVKSEFFQVLFKTLRLFIRRRGSFPLSYLYPQFKV